MFHCITDPVSVFGILEKHGQENFDPLENYHAFFSCENEFAALIFVCDGPLKGPRLFLFRKPVSLAEIESTLVEASVSGKDELSSNAFDAALRSIRQMIETREAGFYFFDAH